MLICVRIFFRFVIRYTYFKNVRERVIQSKLPVGRNCARYKGNNCAMKIEFFPLKTLICRPVRRGSR